MDLRVERTETEDVLTDEDSNRGTFRSPSNSLHTLFTYSARVGGELPRGGRDTRVWNSRRRGVCKRVYSPFPTRPREGP